MKSIIINFIKSLFFFHAEILLKFKMLNLSNKYWSALHLRQLILFGYNPSKIINKVAFIILDQSSYTHVIGIIKFMPVGSFEIILLNTVSIFKLEFLKKNLSKRLIAINSLRKKIKENVNCNIRNLNEVFSQKLQYQCAVLGNPDFLFHRNGVYGIEFFAKKLVRVMFSIGAGNYIFHKKANAIFDTLFCNGEYQKERYEALGIKAEVIASGSPRFDKGNKAIDKEVFLKNYGLDKNKKTILWLPTHTKATSVVNFLDIMQILSIHYNVILKAHTGCYSEIKNLPQLISAIAPNIINISNMESTELLGVGDYVFCDYGGSVFTAIYNDKNVLLLNAEDKYVHKLIGKDSPEVEIRKEIINFYKHEGDQLISALRDEKIWEEQKAIRKRIKDRFFSTYSEPSGKIIADLLLKKLEQTTQGEAS